MTASAIRKWCWVHKWSSLVSTAFLLMLCITGLPLIFHHEIDELLGNEAVPRPLAAGTPALPLERLVESAQARFAELVVLYVVTPREEPDLAEVIMAGHLGATRDFSIVTLDARTGEILLERTPSQWTFMRVVLQLHVDMFAGLPGMLFLGGMGLLLVVAIVSGAVIYGRFMRRLDFGTVRARSGSRIKWIDVHNLLGVVVLAWLLVVGVTGAINATTTLVLSYWRSDQLTAMLAPHKASSLPDKARGSVDLAVATALRGASGMKLDFIAFPGTIYTSPHHYAVFLRGERAWSARLLQPALVDATTGDLTDTREAAWYVKMLLLSQPLHFGDYGGMPLKIIWAVLDLITIAILVSGLYLWLSRRRSPLEERVAEIESGGATQVVTW
jgi:uncharacterized iron-regulated membrane protein